MTNGSDPTPGVDRGGRVAVIEVEGDADLTTTEAVRARLHELAADHEGSVIVDLSDADFIDSPTLGALAFSAKVFSSPPNRFAVICPPGEVRAMFELTALDRVVPLYDTRAEALASIREAPRSR
jgi:anti-sigma B factor antagonist